MQKSVFGKHCMDIITSVFNASPLEDPIQNIIEDLEEHTSDTQKIVVEMEKNRNIFPNEEIDGAAALNISRRFRGRQ